MIKVSPVQTGNNVLNYLSQTTWHYDNAISADYEINSTIGVLFLSLRFHSCKPEYIHRRINRLWPYKLQVLLVHVDVQNYSKSIRELFGTVSLTMVLGFSTEECSRYLQGLNLSNRSVNAIRRKDADPETFLNSFPRINKTDVQKIVEKHSTLEQFFRDAEKAESIQGIGKTKAQNILKYLNMEFR